MTRSRIPRAGALRTAPAALVAFVLAAVLHAGCQKEQAPVPASSDVKQQERLETVRFWERYRAGMDARRNRDWEEAIAAFTDALSLRSSHEDAHYYLGNVLFEVGRYDEAIEHWEAVLAANPLASRAHVQLGSIHACPEIPRLFDLEEAARQLEMAHALNPEETGPMTRLGEVRLALGDEIEAEKLLAAARRTNPRAASAHYLCAFLALKRGARSEAEAALAQAKDALHVVRTAAVPMLEGDVRKEDAGDGSAQTMSQRRLFAPLLAGLAQRESLDVAAEARRVAAYLRSLPQRRRPTAGDDAATPQG